MLIMDLFRKEKLYQVIFESDTRAGRNFDLSLMILIILSIISVSLESVKSIDEQYGTILYVFEWIITGIFTIEYLVRIYIVKNKLSYFFSFFGIIDLLSILPTYLGIFINGAQGLMVIRALRLLRIFRILKLTQFIYDSRYIVFALRESRTKISVFLYAIILLVIIIGTAMYLIEGEESGFNNIPESIYWAIVTLTTVGYGDIAPVTALGRFLASLVMILGYSIIAVPTGIVTAEFSRSRKKMYSNIVCPECLSEDNDQDAEYCKKCGSALNPEELKTNE
jgi:voltage-gated potassium channel